MSITPDFQDFKCAPAFNDIKQALEKNGDELTKKIGGVIEFNIVNGPGGKTARWLVDAKNGKGSITCEDCNAEPDVSVTIADEKFMKLMSRGHSVKKAYFLGEMKVKGKPATSMKFQEIKNYVQKMKAKM